MIVNLDALKEHIHVDFDDDDGEIERLLLGAQNYIESLLGYEIEKRFDASKGKEIPPALIVAVCQLVAHWYENREAVTNSATSYHLPMTVRDIIRQYRDWSW